VEVHCGENLNTEAHTKVYVKIQVLGEGDDGLAPIERSSDSEVYTQCLGTPGITRPDPDTLAGGDDSRRLDRNHQNATGKDWINKFTESFSGWFGGGVDKLSANNKELKNHEGHDADAEAHASTSRSSSRSGAEECGVFKTGLSAGAAEGWTFWDENAMTDHGHAVGANIVQVSHLIF
jgi:hypothetical protein